jgi:hypothetical protein
MSDWILGLPVKTEWKTLNQNDVSSFGNDILKEIEEARTNLNYL